MVQGPYTLGDLGNLTWGISIEDIIKIADSNGQTRGTEPLYVKEATQEARITPISIPYMR
jgi:hypothetical protein